jgi:hypothetical protein
MKGCGKPSHGKPYCPKHMTLAQRRALPDEQQKLIRSFCHKAPCKQGDTHEDGTQYCTECKEPCLWLAA